MVSQLVRAIKPKPLELEEVRKMLLDTMNKTGDVCIQTFQRTTQGWRGVKPTFIAETTIENGNAILRVFPTGDGANKWVWLDEGTKPHPILPRRAKRLRFFIGGKAGSTPGNFISKTSTPGNKQVFSKGVMHPGIKPRNWSKTLTDNTFPKFYSDMNAAVAYGIEKATRR